MPKDISHLGFRRAVLEKFEFADLRALFLLRWLWRLNGSEIGNSVFGFGSSGRFVAAADACMNFCGDPTR